MVSRVYNIMGECQSTCNSEEAVRGALEQSVRIEYNGERFIMPEKFTFDKQTTFTKVEHAARSFCQRTASSKQKTASHLSTLRFSLASSLIATSSSSRRFGSGCHLRTAISF